MTAVKSFALVVLVVGVAATWARAGSTDTAQSRFGFVYPALPAQFGSIVTNLAPAAASPSAGTAPTSYNALLNMGNGPYPGANWLTSGGAQPWYLSPSVLQAYGHVPTPEEQAAFVEAVKQDVLYTYHHSGDDRSTSIDLKLTTNPSDAYTHAISVVAGTSSPMLPGAAGIAAYGGDGFSFIDQLKYATSPEELEWAVAHNVAHELMHTLGVDHHDQTGANLDSAVSQWTDLVNPSYSFSSAATAEIAQHLNDPRSADSWELGGEQIAADGMVLAGPHPVPEPATLALWGLAAVGLISGRRLHPRRAA
ncbi:MAG: PEP-CTERM sorting domain-containing protein [Isosphaeraceae bacterium]|nr:PEP-CTERM sorting domain-containing protein [Isosphaeraceae bacterium]